MVEGFCHYCGQDGPLTRDHLVPKSRMFARVRALPSHGEWNIVLSCGLCNSTRGSMPYPTFAAKRGVTFDEIVVVCLRLWTGWEAMGIGPLPKTDQAAMQRVRVDDRRSESVFDRVQMLLG